MSILTGKQVLVIGDETQLLTKIEAALITYGATIKSVTCQSVTEHLLKESSIGLILLNHLHEKKHCTETLGIIKQSSACETIPTLVLVENNRTNIAEVLLNGAADYFTEHEDVHTVIEKIKQVLGSSDESLDVGVLDISDTHAVSQSGTRVMAIEDDQLLQNLLATRFEKSKLVFEMASDGVGLIDKMIAFKPQILVLDIMLPGEDGLSILKRIKDTPETKDVPVLIFSNKDSQLERQQASDLGAVGFHVKAMTDLSELLSIINIHKRPQ